MIQHTDSLLECLPLVTYRLRVEAPSAAVYVSPQIEEMFGIEPAAFEEDDDVWIDRIVPDDRPGFLAALESLRDGADRMAVEYRVRNGAGKPVWVRDIAALEEGYINGCLVDITREKELEQELAVERATLDAFFAQSKIGLGITDAEGRYVRINDSLARIKRGSPGDFLGRTLEETRPGIASTVDPLRARAGEGGQIDVHLGDQHVLLSYFAFEALGERYLGRAAVDVTEQHRAQVAERRYLQLIEQLPLVVYVNDVQPQRQARFVTACVEELTGYTAEEFVADPTLGDRVIHPEDLERIRALEQSGDVFEHEYRIVRRDGTVRWVLDRMETVRDEAGKELYEQGFLVDVTDRHDTAALLRAVWDGALEAMLIADDDGRYVDANPAACSLFGRPREELVGRYVGELDTGSDPDWGGFLARGSASLDMTIVRPDGERRVIQGTARADVMPGRHLAVVHDVTERRLLEAEARRAQKLESVARLAGGVAHDFNNLLTAIRGYAQLLQGRVSPDSVEHHHAREIDLAADRAAALTAQLLALGRRQTLRARPLDLNRRLKAEADALADLAGPRSDLVFDLDPALCAVRADGPLLTQAIANIVANAGEAMPDGGTVVVRTRNAEVSGREELADGTYAVVSIVDTGRGLDETTLEHLFEPFFTTKDVGDGGGGLGLASAYGTVKQSGGTIVVESEPGVGTTFSLYLPVEQATQGTILLVERDPSVRDLVFELLTDASYRVLTAHTTADAVRIAEGYEDPIDLLLSDLDELRERALTELLRVRRPELQALSLPKPYAPDRLREAVRAALASPKRVTARPTSA